MRCVNLFGWILDFDRSHLHVMPSTPLLYLVVAMEAVAMSIYRRFMATAINTRHRSPDHSSSLELTGRTAASRLDSDQGFLDVPEI